MKYSDMVHMVEDLHGEARRRSLYFQDHDGGLADGRHILVNDRELLWFGSCSYLGLEREPELVEGAIDALRCYGTQFASSRGYVSLHGHRELEGLLSEMFGGYALLAQTTTLGHMAAFDALLTEQDALILDHQAHASMQVAATLVKARGATVVKVHHEELPRAIDLARDLARKHRRVWFATDGITSMYGDLAPYDLLGELLDVAPNVHLYVDDAHGTGWAGARGRGHFLEVFGFRPRLVVATSLAKSFAAGGAALVFHDSETREHVRLTGGSMVFSGPLQPALLGAAVGSTRLHLGPSLPERQRDLWRRVRALKEGLLSVGVPLLADNDVPVSFVPLIRPAVAIELAESLAALGYYTNVSMFPSVPQDRAGLRLTVTNHLTLGDISGLVSAIGSLLPGVLQRHGLSVAQLQDTFARVRVGNVRPKSRRSQSTIESAIAIEPHRSIREVNRVEWDALLGHAGTISAASLEAVEAIFKGPEPEHTWEPEYLLARGASGRPAAGTVFFEMLVKDDQFSTAEVSREIERLRESDPYAFTSRCLVMGGGLSEGDHLYLDREGDWKPALRLLLRHALDRYEERKLDMVMIRDLPASDAELGSVLLDEGFVPVPVPDRHVLRLEPGQPPFGDLPRRSQRLLRRRIEEHGRFKVKVGLSIDPAAMHRMYRAVAQRNLQFNTFELPVRLWETLSQNPSWEIVTLLLEDGGVEVPVAWFAAHLHGLHYAPLVCGLDYHYVNTAAAYRHMLLEIVLRASRLGMRAVHMGMEASREKTSLGAVASATTAYVFARDSFKSARLQEITEALSFCGVRGRDRGGEGPPA
jgi:7-keto-8-aminopelargonate synthetase-like enzyme